MRFEELFDADILQALKGRPWEENPLVTIGLSPAIFNLKVNDHQLFNIVRSYARQLAKAVHPDNVGEAKTQAIAADRTRIITAVGHLTDEKSFFMALAEFKTLRSREREELNVEREVVRKLREELAILNSRS
jgi:DnaJ-domain-containing protein 1